MPKFIYECNKCGVVATKISYTNAALVCTVNCKECGSEMHKQITNPLSHTDFVTADKYRNKKVLKDINKVMKKRSRDHQKENLLGEQIEQFGKDMVSDMTFFNKDGTVKSGLDEK